MSSSTPGTLSAIRRLKQVYVEIPPSPLHRNSPSFSKLLPQNMPLSPTRSNMPVAPTHKRKLSNATQPVSKKQKVDVGSQKENSSNNITKEQSGPTAFYCHQCSKKRDASGMRFHQLMYRNVTFDLIYTDILFCTFSQASGKGKGKGREIGDWMVKEPEPRRMVRCAVVDPVSGEELDDGLAVFFRGACRIVN